MTRILVFLVAVLLTSRAAQAQSAQPAPIAAGQRSTDAVVAANLLAGPKVPDDAYGQTDSSFGGRQRGGRQINVQPGQWFGVLSELDLSEQQRAEIRAIHAELQQARRAFQRGHGSRMRQLQRKARAAHEAGQEPSREVREELPRLRSQIPPGLPYQQRAWAVLNHSQQDRVRAALAEFRKGIAARRSGQRPDMVTSPRRTGRRDRSSRGPNQGSEAGRDRDQAPGESSPGPGR